MALTCLQNRKSKIARLKQSRMQGGRMVDIVGNNAESGNGSQGGQLEHGNGLAGGDIRTIKEYYEITESLSREDLQMILRLFLPDCGVLSKNRAAQWGVIREKILPKLCRRTVDHQQESLKIRLDQIDQELLAFF